MVRPFLSRAFVGRSFEIAFWLAGSILVWTAGYRVSRYTAFQARPDWFVNAAAAPRVGSLARSSPDVGLQILGRLIIPRLQVNLTVLEGDDDSTLAIGPGHLRGSAALGSSGNAVIAGHRDMAFRGLRHIRVGDQIRFEGSRTYTYMVRRMQVVKPENLSVLEDTGEPMLTMITCYPFQYAGNAPERYVVQAALVDGK